MAEKTFKAVKFIPKPGDQDFGKAIKKRVSAYFKENKKSRLGDYRIWIKVIVLPALYLVPFVFLLTNSFNESLLLFYGLWLLMGVGMAGSGLGIMHDACHGAISKKKWVNTLIGNGVINLAGGHAMNWKIQHNVLHHSYTNIDGYDEDIDPSGVMRFSPHQPVKPIFKYQIYYAWFFYALMTLSWATIKDFAQLKRYDEKGLIKAQGSTYGKQMVKLLIGKVIYYSIFIGLPLIFIDIAWYHIIIGWLLKHFLAGLTLALVFQPAHVVPSSEFPLPDKENHLSGDWAKHQMETTADFAQKNRILSWYMGGLNFQIEHHLFPTMSHVHHRAISSIVKATAKEYNVPYYSEPTFTGAIIKHAKTLYKFRK